MSQKWKYVSVWECVWASSGSMVKNPLANAGDLRDPAQSLGREDRLEQGMTTHSSIFAWKIPWTEQPGRLQSRVTRSWTWPKQLSTEHECMCTCKFFLFWLSWVFIALLSLSLAAASWCYFSLQCTDLSRRWLFFLQSTGSGAWAQWLCLTGLADPWHVESSWTGDIPYNGKWIPIHGTTGEVRYVTFKINNRRINMKVKNKWLPIRHRKK